MLTANELRIGNIVACDFIHTPDGVHIISGEDIYMIQTGCQKAELLGIPLTARTLEQCGYAFFEGYWHHEFVDLKEDKDGFYLCIEDEHDYELYTVSRAFQYVHQLQNLYFALCGEELSIKILK